MAGALLAIQNADDYTSQHTAWLLAVDCDRRVQEYKDNVRSFMNDDEDLNVSDL